MYHVTTEPKEFQGYQGLFSDTAIGKLPLTYKMKVDKEVIPVVKASRRLHVAYMEDVKKELHRMEGLGVIRRAEESRPIGCLAWLQREKKMVALGCA